MLPLISFILILLLILNYVVWQSFLVLAVIILGLLTVLMYIKYGKPGESGKFIILLLAAGMLLRVAYLGKTPFNIRGHDADGHVQYINYVVDNAKIPPASQCMECYHPPLYYIVAAPICEISHCRENGYRGLQIFSLLCSLGFLIFGIKTVRLYFPPAWNDKFYHMAAAILIFWPSAIIDSVRIGNDILFYFFAAGAIYFASLWFVKGRHHQITWILLFCLGAIVTKSNGLLLPIIFAAAWLTKVILHDQKTRTGVAGLLAILFLSLTLIPYLRVSIVEKGIVENTNGLSSQLSVGNNLENYVHFDGRNFLNMPFTDPWNDTGGRQYYINFLLKTALFGEYNFQEKTLRSLAILMSYLIIAVILISILGLLILCIETVLSLFKPKQNKFAHLLIPCIILIFLAASIYVRHTYPFAPSGDWRYIFPILIPFSGAIVYGLHTLSMVRSPFGKIFSFISDYAEYAIYSFLVASIFFFIFLAAT